MNRKYVFSMDEVRACDITLFRSFLRGRYPEVLTPDDVESLTLDIDFDDSYDEIPYFPLDEQLRRFARELHRSIPWLCVIMNMDSVFYRNILACRYKVVELIERAGQPNSAQIGFLTEQRMMVDSFEILKIDAVCRNAGFATDITQRLVCKFVNYNPRPY